MRSARYTAAQIALDVATAFVPRGLYETRAHAVAEHARLPETQDADGWDHRRVASSDGSYEHDFYVYPSSRPDAPTLVLLHGLFLDGRSFFNLSGLSSDFELVAYNYPQRCECYEGTMDDFASVLDDFAAVMELKKFALGGTSLGGMVALHWASTLDPSKLTALVLISTRVPGVTESQRREAREAYALLDRYPDYRLVWLQDVFQRLYAGRFKGDEREQVQAALRPKDIAFYRQAMSALHDYNGAEAARKITAPVLFLLGTNDKLIPMSSVDELKSLIPHVQVELIEKGPHIMTYLDGAEVSERIRSFLVG